MCSTGDLEPCAVWQEFPRRARKPHACGPCDSIIPPGDYYLVHFSIFDGEVTSEKVCFACWWAREDFCRAHGDGQLFQPSGLISALQDCVGENDDPEDRWRPVLAAILRRHRVAPRAREFQRRRWDKRRSAHA